MTKDTASGYGWLARLTCATTVEGVTALSVRHRVGQVIGEDATGWGIETGYRMADYILGTLTDWPGDRSQEERQILHRATEATTLDTLAALVSGDQSHLWASFEPIENIGWYVRKQIPLSEVLRNVHSGQEFLIQELMDAAVHLLPEHESIAAIGRVTRDVTGCWSNFISRIGEEYHRQHEEWIHSSEGQRTRVVQGLLQGGDADPGQASRSLGYDLAQRHTGVLLWFEGLDLETVRLFDWAAIGRDLAAATASDSYLALEAAGHRFEVWLGEPSYAPADVLRSGGWHAALHAGVGTPGHGVEGFAATHKEAQACSRVALRAAGSSRVIDYADAELVSLLTCDFERARSFVARTLGPLARQDTRCQDLRTTLSAWIDSSGSVAATSQALYMHRNTVSYRLRQLDDMLGDGWDHTRVRCALTIAEWMPQTLQPTE